MLQMTTFLVATFTAPQEIGINPQSLLWLLPLVTVISIIYKATKVKTLKVGNFLKEVGALFVSIIVFMAITAMVLHIFTYVVLE